jgi:hypothetical protein
MGTDVLVATDVMLDYCQLRVVVEEHGHSEVSSITIDFLLHLPSWIFLLSGIQCTSLTRWYLLHSLWIDKLAREREHVASEVRNRVLIQVI